MALAELVRDLDDVREGTLEVGRVRKAPRPGRSGPQPVASFLIYAVYEREHIAAVGVHDFYLTSPIEAQLKRWWENEVPAASKVGTIRRLLAVRADAAWFI